MAMHIPVSESFLHNMRLGYKILLYTYCILLRGLI